jgi:hypothetical protein
MRLPALLLTLAALLVGAGRVQGAEPVAPLPAPAAAIAEAVGLPAGGYAAAELPFLVARRLHVPWGERGRGIAGQQRLATLCLASGSGGETVPTLLDARQWSAVLGQRLRPATLACALLTEPRAAWLLHGLAGVSPATRDALAADPESLREIARESGPAFAAFAASLAVEDGAVAVPGGADARALWEERLEASATRPARFARALLGRAGGREAYLYATLAALGPQARSWAMGLDETDPERRRDRFEALLDAFASETAWWDPARPPLSRRRVDGARVLLTVRVDAAGRMAAPATRGFWSAAFADRNTPGTDATPVDAGWLVREIGQAGLDGVAQQRLGQLQFGQRLLAAGGAADGDALAAVRSAGDRPALALAMELLAAPVGLHASARRRAEALVALPRDRAAAAVAQFQGALALLLDARRHGLLEEAATLALLRGLLAVDTRGDQGYDGRLVEWFESQLLPQLARATWGEVPPPDADAVVARALAGVRDRPGAGADATFRFEGLDYRADVAGARARRLREFADSQSIPLLAAALDFARAARSYRAAAGPRTLAALRESLAALAPFVPPGGEREVDPGLRVDEVAAGLRRGGGLRDVSAERLTAAADAAVADALVGLLYAAHAGPLQDRAPEALARRHEFGLGVGDAEERARIAFALPHAVSGAGRPWHLEGALPGLEAGFARAALRRASPDPPSHAPELGDAERQALGHFVGQLAALDPAALPDPARVREAVERGRALTGDAAPGLGLAELAARGGIEWPAGFGAPRLLTEHRLGLAPPLRATSWDLFGRERDGLLVERSLDLPVRLLLSLERRGLPGALLPALFPYAAQDAFENLRLLHAGDETAFARFSRDLPEHRVDDYLAALAGDGALVAAEVP